MRREKVTVDGDFCSNLFVDVVENTEESDSAVLIERSYQTRVMAFLSYEEGADNE